VAPVLIADARIEERVAEVNDQVDQHIGCGKDQDDPLNDRIVATQDRIDGQPAEARDREYRFGDDDTRDQRGHPDPDDRRDRHGCIL